MMKNPFNSKSRLDASRRPVYFYLPQRREAKNAEKNRAKTIFYD
jgi:hypothetical protein